jgi:hypothetical protein
VISGDRLKIAYSVDWSQVITNVKKNNIFSRTIFYVNEYYFLIDLGIFSQQSKAIHGANIRNESRKGGAGGVTPLIFREMNDREGPLS